MLGCAAFWGAGVAAVWLFARFHNDIPHVRYRDLLLPTRWHHYRAAVGAHQLSLSQAALKNGDFPRALNLAATGVRMSPANFDGRLLLAQMLASAQRHDAMAQVLRAGLEAKSAPGAYTIRSLQLLRSANRHADVDQITREVLAAHLADPALLRAVALFAAESAYQTFDYRRAAELLVRYRLFESPDGVCLAAQMDWDRNLHDVAIQRLRSSWDAFPTSSIYPLLAKFLREKEKASELTALSLEQLARDPASFAPRIELLRAYDLRRAQTQLEAESLRFLSLFSGDNQALLALGDFAAHAGNPRLAIRVLTAASSTGCAAEPFQLLLAEAHLCAGEHQQALACLHSPTLAEAGKRPDLCAALTGLETAALFGTGDTAGGRARLLQFLSLPGVPVENLLVVSQRLVALGRTSEARDVLLRAHHLFPQEPAILDELVRLDLTAAVKIGTLAADTAQLIAAGNYRLQTLRAANSELASDRHLFEAGQAPTLRRLGQILACVDAPNLYPTNN